MEDDRIKKWKTTSIFFDQTRKKTSKKMEDDLNKKMEDDLKTN